MERFDKAYKGLNCHVNGYPHTRCYKCPYWGTGPHGSSECNALAVDALALIQQQQARIKELEAAQTARVMTLEEIPKYDGAFLIESRSESWPMQWALFRLKLTMAYRFIRADHELGFSLSKDSYGRTWRCWTQRPTDEQREATLWEN